MYDPYAAFMRRALILFTSGLAALTVACGGDDEPAANRPGTSDATASATATATTTATATPSPIIGRAGDRQAAEQSTLQLEDFPSGWTQDDKASSNRARCDAVTEARSTATGTADANRFNNGDTTQVQSTVYVFADEAEATDAFANLSSKETRACYAEQVTDAFSSQDELEIGEVRTGSLSLDPLGDARAASRVTIPVSADGIDVDVLVDLVFIRVGRGLSLGLFVDTFSPFDEDLRGDLSAKTVRRLESELNG